MGFFKNLFKRKTEDDYYDEFEWDKVTIERESLNMKDPVVREQYVLNCLEQMKDTSEELDRLKAEYDLVTSYLTDMEDIEAMPKPDKSNLEEIAKHLHDLRKAHDDYVLTPSLISETDYNHVSNMFSEIENGIKKLEEEEDMRDKIRADLKRIDKERHAYEIRRREIRTAIENSRGIATIAMVAAATLILIFIAMQVLLKFDVTIGYYITVAVLAIAITIIYVRYTDFVSEKNKIDNTVNELILLENKVKIRYVNNRHLLDFLYNKYDVANSSELRELYEKYVEEREARRKYERNEAVYEEELTRLIRALRKYDIKHPDVWKNQSDAIYDNREMVEIRHKLIGRRQKLRKQMEYNQQMALDASDEIKDIIREYPEYADSIMTLVNAYEKEK